MDNDFSIDGGCSEFMTYGLNPFLIFSVLACLKADGRQVAYTALNPRQRIGSRNNNAVLSILNTHTNFLRRYQQTIALAIQTLKKEHPKTNLLNIEVQERKSHPSRSFPLGHCLDCSCQLRISNNLHGLHSNKQNSSTYFYNEFLWWSSDSRSRETWALSLDGEGFCLRGSLGTI